MACKLDIDWHAFIKKIEINTEDAKMLIQILKIFLQVVIKGENYAG